MLFFKKKKKERDKNPQEADRVYREGMVTLRDLIAPSSLEVNTNFLKLGSKFIRTLFTFGYPRYLFTNWLSPIINMDAIMDISMFIYPVDSRTVLENLRKKVTYMEATWDEARKKGRVRDPGLEAALKDAEELRDKLQTGESRFFRLGLYFTIFADSLDELNKITRQVETILGSTLIYTKYANLQMEQGLTSTLPLAMDEIYIHRNMDTGALSSAFPFTSANLSSNKGVLYGINGHNNSLIIFDRFDLENANMVVFATSGAGKSYTIKLEALRSLMFGTEIIIIDPENEYQTLCEAVGGSYLKLSISSKERVNPFDLPRILDQKQAEGILTTNIIMLHGLLRLMLGGLTPEEDSFLDKALIETYTEKGITNDPLTHMDINSTRVPVMGDLTRILKRMSGCESLAQRLSKYTEGSFSGIFNQQTNIDLSNKFVVFSIRDLEEQLRPIAMYIILNYIWNRVKSDMKRRLLIIEEAWQMMKYEDSAQFLFSIAKRARKNYLGLTCISQDVEDFLGSKYGRAVVTNSSLQILLKQSPASVDVITNTFNLTNEEKRLLTQFQLGEGLFFAGTNHVIIRVIASPMEDQLITTNPEQLLAIQAQKEKKIKEKAT
ncbi:MAG: DUF87 domain-containing protein [Candidatus Aenigmarchaeota archaeon]|nr:DUF87 domain-containing protein [Candidatus Aenigmarchaeota archaeon]